MPKESKTKLFHNKVIEKYIKSITISSKQREALNLWVDKLKKKELIEERSNYPIFQKYIVEDILGYSVEDFDFEKGNVEFTIKNQSGKPLLVLELKGQETDLFSKQSTGVTPYKQAFLYAVEKGTEYFATCNYSQIVFFLKENNYSRYEILDFQEMSKNENEFKKFILLFSKEYLVKRNMPALLKTDTIQEEKELTKEFYKIYHETRLMIIKELEVECKLSKEKAIHYSQIFLNRIMFICFAQDSEKHLLEPLILENTILKPIEKEMVGEHTHYIWESLVNLFRSINLGDRIRNIPKYNGGLFSEDIPNDVKIRDFPVNQKYFNELNQGSKYSEKDINITILQRMGKYRTEINPIYKNLLLISSFDFKTDINVNILGHIFEQSIGDIEDLLSQNVSQRKKFGVFYTPEYITEYISRSAIIPYLSKTGNAKDIDELIYEYYNDLDQLEDKVKKIKILDPACGSGAFLNKTVDVLLEIHRAIYETKLQKGKYKTTVEERHKRKKIEVEMESITLYFDDIEQQREIILNNIFGVDINEESVEITKLSLFLKIAARDIVLPNIDNNIKCGNSLIDDPAIAGDKAFKWEEKFPEVMKEGGFDIVIGNPPYVKEFVNRKIFEDVKKGSSRVAKYYEGKMDYLYFFIELGIDLLKDEGYLSFITTNYWLQAEGAKKLREKILKETTIISVFDFNEFKVFEGTGQHNLVFILQKKKNINNKIKVSIVRDKNILKNKIISALQGKDGEEKIEKFISQPQKEFLQNKDFKISFISDKIESMCKKIKSQQNYSFSDKDVAQGIVIPQDKVIKSHLTKLPNLKIGEGIFVVNNEELERLKLNSNEINIIKPYYTTENLGRYFADKYNKEWIIYTTTEVIKRIDLFPKIKMHLDKFKKIITSDFAPYGLHRAREERFFLGEKIIALRKTKIPCFSYVGFPCYVSSTFFIIKPENINLKYLTGILNSKVVHFWLYFKGKKEGDQLQIDKAPILSIPIKIIPESEQQPLIKLVDKMLSLHKRLNELGDKKTDERTKIEEEIKKTDREIDELVYKLYGITEEEKRIIEERLK